MKLIVTYELDTREGVAELLAATKHLELCPLVSSAKMTEEEYERGWKDPRKEARDGADLEQAEKATTRTPWDDIAVEFQRNMENEGYIVTVLDNDGMIVKTPVHLYEWSGPVTEFINEKDAAGLIAYLSNLNTTTEGMRDGAFFRASEDR